MARGRLPHWLSVGVAMGIGAIALQACVRQGPPAPIDNRGNLFFGRGTAIPVARPAVERPPPRSGTAGAAPLATTPSTLTVQSGDTLYGISRKTNVPIRAIITANNLTPPYYLPVGRQLVIPRQSYHRVAAGETVATIARIYGVSTQDLVRSNGIEPPYLVYIGQPLIIPAPTPGGTTQPTVGVASLPPSTSPSTSPPSPLSAPSSAPQAPSNSLPPGPGSGPPDAMPPDTLASLPPPPLAPPEPPISAPPGAFIWPVQGRVLSGFGPKPGGLINDGINIAAPLGSPVRASQDGTIAYAGNELRGYGNLLLVRHDNGWVSAYAHNSELAVGRGDRVKRGQIIARVGASGSVSEPQLHFEIRQGTRTVDPMRYLSGQG